MIEKEYISLDSVGRRSFPEDSSGATNDERRPLRVNDRDLVTSCLMRLDPKSHNEAFPHISTSIFNYPYRKKFWLMQGVRTTAVEKN